MPKLELLKATTKSDKCQDEERSMKAKNVPVERHIRGGSTEES